MGDMLILHQYTENAYLEYAIATVKDRALAQVQDGQKPVQRRILYSMRGMGLTSTAKPRKSAAVVGDVLGKLHPHGDSSVYDAMVRMAQDFSLRYPLIQGQGNFGSRDGDTAAAMRYTECRLSPIAELLLTEVDQETVDFADNYDGTQQEPRVLPARLPMLLLNGTMGIAVGMAADIPPHNVREVGDAAALMVREPDTSLETLLTHIKGPDFPDGGQLISSSAEVAQAYATGRGTLRCRARWRREEMARGQWQVVITELPYQVSTRKILEQIDTLTNPQPPAGKKSITQQQAQLKQLALEYLERASDESDKDCRVRLVLAPRTAKVDVTQMMAFLLANTDLEVTVSLNMNLVGLDGRPQTKGLRAILSEWAEFRVLTVRRRTVHELDLLERRMHTLEGRLTVFLNLDAVIRVIRDAEAPKEELRAQFGLSEAQAEDILEMRLRQLNKLEGFKLERELEEGRKTAARLRKLLDTPAALRRLIATEIEADVARFGDDRRTLIEEAARMTASSAAVRTVPDEEVTVTLSKNLWVKAYRGNVPVEELTYRVGDAGAQRLVTRTVNQLVLLDSTGRAYSLDVSAVPLSRGDGAPLSTLVELRAGASLVSMLDAAEDSVYLFAGQTGYGFTAMPKSLVTRQRAGKAFLDVGPGECALPPVQLTADAWLHVMSNAGRELAFAAQEVKALEKGGKGVQLMKLDDGVLVTHLAAVPAKVATEPYAGKRGGRGKPVPEPKKSRAAKKR